MCNKWSASKYKGRNFLKILCYKHIFNLTNKENKMKQQKGYVIYEGPSAIDNQPIVVIATMKTTNIKTGQMIQVWILRSDINPVEASKTSQDISICGDCPARHSLGGHCYVNIGQAPNSIYKSYKKGNYPHIEDFNIFQGKEIRFGAYGDPVNIPLSLVKIMARTAKKWTGYTHQWQNPKFDAYKQFFMASTDNEAQTTTSHNNDWRSFRVITTKTRTLPNEMECLSDSKGLQCKECTLCNGNKAGKSIFITVHGSRSKRFEGAK